MFVITGKGQSSDGRADGIQEVSIPHKILDHSGLLASASPSIIPQLCRYPEGPVRWPPPCHCPLWADRGHTMLLTARLYEVLRLVWPTQSEERKNAALLKFKSVWGEAQGSLNSQQSGPFPGQGGPKQKTTQAREGPSSGVQ